jgi:hypothetical protein
MRKTYVITALFLLSASAMAQPATQQSVYPNGSPPVARAEMAQSTQRAWTDARDKLLEGCVQGTRDNLTLTDAAGKVYQLRGDTTLLADHIGQQASIIGTETPRSGPGFTEAQPTFTVKKVKMIASVCSASK